MGKRFHLNVVYLVISLAAVLVSALLYSSWQAAKPPVQWAIYNAPTIPICSGSPLEFQSTVTFNDDGIIELAAVVVSEDTLTTVYRSDVLPLSVRLAGEVIPLSWQSITLPKLNAGRYTYRLGAASMGKRPSVLVIPFEVVSCGG